jgi:hypothetical protein
MLARKAKLQAYIAIFGSKAQTRYVSRLEYSPEAFSATAVSSLIGQGRIAKRPAKQLVAVLLVQAGLLDNITGGC